MATPDPVAFLRSTPPFDGLPEEAFEAAARHLEVVSFPAGTRVIRQGGTPSDHLYVIRKGAVRLERDGLTLQVLEEGESFGFTSLITRRATIDAVVEEDLLAYRLPREQFTALLSHAAFAGHFASGLGERLRNSLERSQAVGFQADLGLPVERLLRRAAVKVPATSTVGEAARVMSEHNVSSVLVETEPPGILTDRDLRSRVLARGRGAETPVTEVYSAPLRTIAVDTPVYEAWRTLLESGVHHLPVTRGGAIVGVVSATDLLKCTAQGPVTVMKRVEHLGGREALPGYGDRVTEMASALFGGGLDPTVIAGFVARLNDTLVHRLLRWAEADLGPPPCRFAWVVFGSEGRMEQLLLTDQDNALVYAEDTPEAKRYFTALAEKVTADLVAAGFPACPGGYMAPTWNGPLAAWDERFWSWIRSPTPQGLLEASIFFDMRPVAGTLGLEALDALRARAGREHLFLSCMAKAALAFQPPGGLKLRLRGSKVDLKLHGISPIVFLARCYALEVGSAALNTLERLEAAVAAGLLEKDACATLTEVFRFLLRLRLREQLRMSSERKPLVNEIALAELSSIERSRLKDAFRAIEVWQERAAFHYRTHLF